jgi:hypothetical protein
VAQLLDFYDMASEAQQAPRAAEGGRGAPGTQAPAAQASAGAGDTRVSAASSGGPPRAAATGNGEPHGKGAGSHLVGTAPEPANASPGTWTLLPQARCHGG